MQYWPFCSNPEITCDPTVAIVLAPFVFLAILALVVYSILNRRSRKNPDLESLGETPVSEEDNNNPQEAEPKVEDVKTKEPTLAEMWLTENNLDDDTYDSLLYDYCGFRNNRFSIQIKNVDFIDYKITTSLKFPRTSILQLVTLGFEQTSFHVTEDKTGLVQGDFFFQESLLEESPVYDSEIQTPFEVIDWDHVTNHIAYVDFFLSQNTYDKIFPSVA